MEHRAKRIEYYVLLFVLWGMKTGGFKNRHVLHIRVQERLKDRTRGETL